VSFEPNRREELREQFEAYAHKREAPLREELVFAAAV